jgi:sulfotransferase family protein
MVLIIGGLPSSGTTLLRHLCNDHPDITLTHEFGNFHYVGKPYREYRDQLLKRLWNKGVLENRFLLWSPTNHLSLKIVKIVESHTFIARYLFEMHRYRRNIVDLSIVGTVLQSMFPKAHIVGDKEPHYVFALDELAKVDGLKRLIIYRDCRDVTSSTLENSRTKWRNKTWIKDFNTAEKGAKQWVRAIELMERNIDKLHIIRYEDLIYQPDRELKALGSWLGVDPMGFPKKIIRDTSIGKYKSGLTDEELVTIMEVAGPAMSRLGYT